MAAALDEGRRAAAAGEVPVGAAVMRDGAVVARAHNEAKVGRLVFGAYDDKAGMCGSVGDIARHPRLNHRIAVTGGVEERECGELLTTFFAARRQPAT